MAASMKPPVEQRINEIVTASKPTDKEEYLPPPGMAFVPEITEPKDETPKKDEKEKLVWDYSKLLQGGTLGDLSGNLHHGIAVGTDWDGWELTENEKQQYDKVLGMILEPLLAKVEYLPLVLGVLALVSIEGMKIGNYMKFNRERKEATTKPTTPPATVATGPQPSIPPTTAPPIVPTQTTPPRVALSGEPLPPSRFDNQPAMDASGQNLDALLPPSNRQAVNNDSLGLPPAQRLNPPRVT